MLPPPLRRRLLKSFLLLGSALVAHGEPAAPATASESAAPPSPLPVSIQVDAAAPLGALRPIWRFFGADEPNYATLPDGQKLLADIGALRPGQTYFRAHNMLCTGDGTPALKWGSTNIYTEDAAGNPIYDFTIVDAIFDSYLARGVRPLVQLGFMPQALSTQGEGPYQHSWRPGLRYKDIITGWAYPPKSYDKWRELAYEWTRHCVERYGRAEVEQWYFEVWNEPNGDYWKGTPEEFRKLHDYAIDGVRRALPTARVGGAHTAGAGGKFHREFLDHALRGTNFATGQTGTPLDFVAFHAKGWPTFVDGHVRMGISAQLRGLDEGFSMIASYPELRDRPVIIGESDPDGCAACQGPQLGYRNGTMYSSYTAAVFARHLDLADRHKINLEGAVTWAFEFENEPWFAGFRVLATNGITLPVFNVFRMFSRMDGQRLPVVSSGAVPLDELMKDGVRGAPDVSALASLDGKKLCVLAWHYHDDDLPGPDAAINLALSGLPVGAGRARVTHYRIDRDHSNAFATWQKQGSPQLPTAEQYASLEVSSQLQQLVPPALVPLDDGRLALPLTLPRQAVSLLVIDLP